jgi:iron complex transport system ATP-binding protein
MNLRPDMLPVTLCLDGLTLTMGAHTLLAPLTLAMKPGSLWCLVGANGAGKSTLLATLAGLRMPQGGSVRLNDAVVHLMGPHFLAHCRAFLPQTHHDTFAMSVRDAVMVGRHPHQSGWGWENDDDHVAVSAALHALELDGLASRDVRTLSGGERQRVALATMLAQQTPLMLLDEPVAHLDLHHQIAALELLRSLARHSLCTIVVSIHDINLAREFGTHALLLAGDGSARCGPVHQVLTAEHCSHALRTPMIEIHEGGHSALVAIPAHRH